MCPIRWTDYSSVIVVLGTNVSNLHDEVSGNICMYPRGPTSAVHPRTMAIYYRYYYCSLCFAHTHHGANSSRKNTSDRDKSYTILDHHRYPCGPPTDVC